MQDTKKPTKKPAPAPSAPPRAEVAPEADGPEYVNVVTASAICGGVSYPTFARMRRLPDFPKPFVSPGGRLKWLRSELLAWMEARRAE